MRFTDTQVTLETTTTKIAAESFAPNPGKGYLTVAQIVSTADLVQRTTVQTLNNKTLASPKINIGGDAEGDLYTRNGFDDLIRIPIGANGKIFRSNGSQAFWGDETPPVAPEVTLTNAVTLTNKTLTSPKINLGGDAAGDLYTRDGSGNLVRIAIGIAGQVLSTNGTTASWSTPTAAAVTPTNAVTLENKTLGTGTVVTAATMTLGSDATGDIYYRAASGLLTRLPLGTSGQVLSNNGTIPGWANAGVGLINFTDTFNNAAPNATVTTSILSASGAATSIDMVLLPKGNGGISVDIPDNLASGGNKRGMGAMDFQTIRASNTQVASGAYSFIAGGTNNIASGQASFAMGQSCSSSGAGSFAGGTANSTGSIASDTAAFAFGRQNTASGFASTALGGQENVASGSRSVALGGTLSLASGQDSVVMGSGATTRGITGMTAFASGPFSGQGSCQRGRYLLRRVTTDATQTELTTDGAAPSTTNRVILPNNSVYKFRAQLVGRNTTTGDITSYDFAGVIKRGANAAATAIVATMAMDQNGMDTGASSWLISVDADTTNGSLRIRVTGVAAATIRWAIDVETLEITN